MASLGNTLELGSFSKGDEYAQKTKKNNPQKSNKTKRK